MPLAPLVRKFSWLVFGVVFTGMMGAALLYTFSQPHLYQSTAIIQFDQGPAKIHASQYLDYNETLSFGEMVALCEAPSVTHEIAERLVKSEDFQAFLKPYGYPSDTSVAVVERVLRKNQKVVSHPEAKISEIIYRHPDPRVASLIAKEFGYGWESTRSRIDFEMQAVEHGQREAEFQSMLVKADVSSVGLFRAARADSPLAVVENNGEYQYLSRQLKDDEAYLNDLIKNRKLPSMGGIGGPPYHQDHASPPAKANQYLLTPIIRNLAWGFAGSVIIGVVSGFIFKRSAGCEAPSRGHWEIFRGNFMCPLRSRDRIVFSLVFLAVFTLAVYHVCQQPRIYQSSVTLAVSESAKDYGWDDLRASDFPSWIPVITQRVAMRLTDDYDSPPMVLKSYGLDGGAGLSVIESVLRHNQKEVYHAETGTMDLYYQHQDFKLADNMIRRFANEYEMYCGYQERNDADSFQKSMGRRIRAFERLKPKIELQIQHAEDANRALQSYKEANADLPRDVMLARAEYQKLYQKLEEEQTSLIHLRYQVRDFTQQRNGGPSPVAVIKKSGWAPTNHYLIKPIIVNLGWGFLGAITAGILSVLALRMIPSFSRDHPEPSRKESKARSG